MESLDLHDLTAAYALDALDADEARAYEEHLAHCERCRRELAELSGAATALAYGAEAPAPPESLRTRILDVVRAERGPNVVPLRPRSAVVLRAVAAVAACAAVGFGVWAATLEHSLSSERAALSILSDPAARRVSLQGRAGSLVVAPSGRAALVAQLPAPPGGKTYEAWVIPGGGRPARAGTFGGGTLVLSRPVPAGATVAVTVERSGGVDAPTTKPLLSAKIV